MLPCSKKAKPEAKQKDWTEFVALAERFSAFSEPASACRALVLALLVGHGASA